MARLATLIPARLAGRQRQIERNLIDAAALIERECKAALARPYPRASRPGEAPAKRTGELQEGQYARADLRTRTIEIGNTVPHAQHLIESGRTWQRPTIDRIRPQIDALLLRRGMPFGGAP